MQARRALALATTLPLFLAGCGGDRPSDDPTPIMPDPTTTTPTPTETPTETPTVDPLAIPDAMRDKSPKGAEAAVRHYSEMFNHLIKTGDAEPIRLIFGDRCDICSAMVGLIEVPYGEGNTFTGRDRVKSVKVCSTRRGSATAVVRIESSQLKQFNTDGEKIFLLPADPDVRWTYNLKYQRGHWEILSIEVPE